MFTLLQKILREVEYTEDHFHNKERWFGISADQSGNDWALGETLTGFVATSGNNAWGVTTDAAKIFGTDDTPILTGGLKFDVHKILVTANTSATTYKCRLIWGTGAVADAVTAGQFTEFYFAQKDTDTDRKITEIKCPKLAVDTQVWLEIWNATNDATLTFFVGVHEYNF
jgi:hypothetical protein